jgi:hypothetical protein
MTARKERASFVAPSATADRPAASSSENASKHAEAPHDALDGWTFVKAKRGRKAGTTILAASSTRQQPQSHPFDSDLIADMLQRHQAFAHEWLQSKCCSAIRSLIREQCTGMPPITKAVCLGVGSLQWEMAQGSRSYWVHAQVEAFRVVVEELCQISPRTSRDSCCIPWRAADCSQQI